MAIFGKQMPDRDSNIIGYGLFGAFIGLIMATLFNKKKAVDNESLDSRWSPVARRVSRNAYVNRAPSVDAWVAAAISEVQSQG